MTVIGEISIFLWEQSKILEKHYFPVSFCREQRKLLEKCAATALSSKLVARQKDFFAKMVVDAVSMLDELLPLNMIGMKKVQGGTLEVRLDWG